MDDTSHNKRITFSKFNTSHNIEQKQFQNRIDFRLQDNEISHVFGEFPNTTITHTGNSSQKACENININIYNQQHLNIIDPLKVRRRRVSFSISPNSEQVRSPRKKKVQINTSNLDDIKDQNPNRERKCEIKSQFSVKSNINTYKNKSLNTEDNINEPAPIISSLKSDKKVLRTNKKQSAKPAMRHSVFFLSSKQFQLENIKSNDKTSKGKRHASGYKNPRKPQSQMNWFGWKWNSTDTNQSILMSMPRNELAHEFLINNPLRNKYFYKHQNNFVSTTKYNIFTWIPKSLLIQFSRLANVYFLICAILQSIPWISPLTPVTAIIPLMFVLLVSMIREWIEDFQRYKYDRLSNEEIVNVYRGKQFVWACSSSLEVGEIILWKEGSLIPCDMILIDSSLNEGICYIETSSWDGEKVLKEKISNKATFGIFSKKIINWTIAYKEMKKRQISNDIFDAQSLRSVNHQNLNKIKNVLKIKNIDIQGICQCDRPNPDLYKFTGKMEIWWDNHQKEIFPMLNDNWLLKGSILKNTTWIIGIVAYTGWNNKIFLNAKRPRLKKSSLEKVMEKYLIVIFIFLMLLCLTSCVLYHVFHIQNTKYYDIFIFDPDSQELDSFITFFTYLLLYNTLIPISWMVTMEIVKISQGWFINWDCELYSKVQHKFCNAKSVSIQEDWGNINYIFSDKTGTLTCNKMEFKYCAIGDSCYEYVKDNADNNSFWNSSNFNNRCLSLLNSCNSSSNTDTESKDESEQEAVKFGRNYFLNFWSNNTTTNNPEFWISNTWNINCSENPTAANSGKGRNKCLWNVPRLSHVEQDKSKEISKRIYNFWIALAVAHECVCHVTEDGLEYNGISPDDVELVKTADEQGYSLQKSTTDIRSVKIGDTLKEFEILKILNFSSERKRMSIIVRNEQGQIVMYSKGADCEIKKRWKRNSNNDPYFFPTLQNVKKYSAKGFRTLWVAWKYIPESKYKEWNNKLRNGEMDVNMKTQIVSKLYDDIEQDMTLLGATMVEDKLQDKVPETIKELRMAGIKIWVLTGDKVDTAENIARSSNWISENQKVFTFSSAAFSTCGEDIVLLNTKIEEYLFNIKSFLQDEKEQKEEKVINQGNDQHTLSINVNRYNNNRTVKNVTSSSGIQTGTKENILEEHIFNQSNSRSILFLNKNVRNNNLLRPMNNKQGGNGISHIKHTNGITNTNRKEQSKSRVFSIIIESPLLERILSSEITKEDFLQIAVKASTVVCCRVSALQKSNVVKMIKSYDQKAVTLAIGDGGNDVSMLMEAHIGIGWYGEEGMNAVQASDFSIGEFQFLRHLLFFHGRNNLKRLSNMIFYFFYKNFIFTLSHFLFGSYSLFSGQTIYEDWFITWYNLVFTALPLGVQAWTNFDIWEQDGKIVEAMMPFIYLQDHETFVNNIWIFFPYVIIKGVCFALLNFYIVFKTFSESPNNKTGTFFDLWRQSVVLYTNVIILASVPLIMKHKYFDSLFPFAWLVTSFGMYILFLYFVDVTDIIFNLKGLINPIFLSNKTHLVIWLMLGITWVVDYCSRVSMYYLGSFLDLKLLSLIHSNKISKDECNNDFIRALLKPTGMQIPKDIEFDENINSVNGGECSEAKNSQVENSKHWSVKTEKSNLKKENARNSHNSLQVNPMRKNKKMCLPHIHEDSNCENQFIRNRSEVNTPKNKCDEFIQFPELNDEEHQMRSKSNRDNYILIKGMIDNF